MTPQQLASAHCGAVIQRALGYLKANRVLGREASGREARYDHATVEPAEQALAQDRRSPK